MQKVNVFKQVCPGLFRVYAGSNVTAWAWKITYDTMLDLSNIYPFVSWDKSHNMVVMGAPITTADAKQFKAAIQKAGVVYPQSEIECLMKILHNNKMRLSYSERVEPVPTAIDGWKTPLFDYQTVGVFYAKSLNWRCLIGDDMGLGKTPQGLACIKASGAKRAVIITRAIALDSWARNIRTFIEDDYRIARGTKPVKLLASGKLPKRPEKTVSLNESAKDMVEPIIVLNYEIVSAWKQFLLDYEPDIIILDEGHFLKEETAARTQTVKELLDYIPKVIFLSGTPQPNRTRELYSLLNMIQPYRWGSFYSFARQYCDPKEEVIGRTPVENKVLCAVCRGKGCQNCSRGFNTKVVYELKKAWNYDGSSNEDSLHQRLRSAVMVRRRKHILGKRPSIYQVLDLKPSPKYHAVEDGLLQDLRKKVAILREDVEGLEKALAELDPTDPTHIELFYAAALEKLDFAEEWISDFLENSDKHKLVIFFRHQIVGNALAEWCTKAKIEFVTAYGSKADRKAESKFQEGTARIALCSYDVAREAVTFTAASHMLMLEICGVPGWMKQAMDRIDRVGQTEICNFYFAVLRDSVEVKLIENLITKEAVQNRVLDNTSETKLSVMAPQLANYNSYDNGP